MCKAETEAEVEAVLVKVESKGTDCSSGRKASINASRDNARGSST